MAAVAPTLDLQGDLVAYFQQRTQQRFGEPTPPMVRNYVGKEVRQLLRNGHSPRVIRRAIELLITKKEHPSLLSFRVYDAAQGKAACLWVRHPNKMRLTPEQLMECGCGDCCETIPYSEVG